MAATGIFAEARTAIVNRITSLGLVPVTDPRNARPLTVFVELPTFTSFTYNVGDLTFTLRVLAAPPGNSDSADYLLTTIDTLMADQGLAVTSGQPSLAIIGSQELPAYDLTVRIASRRN
jgi:hypothetical protein